MSKKEGYERIEFLCPEEELSNDHDRNFQINIDFGRSNADDQAIEIFPPSPSSSSPPNDFDIQSQYRPVYGDENCPDGGQPLGSSLASSLTVDSNHDDTIFPFLSTDSRNVINCPLCDTQMRTYYCSRCIHNGHFITVNLGPKAATFSSLDLNNQNSISQSDIKVDEEKMVEERLQIRHKTLARKTDALKKLYCSQKLRLEDTKKLLIETKRQLEKEKKASKSKENKIELIKHYITSRKASIKKRRDSESCLIDDLKQYVHRRVYQLTTDIFLVEEINLMEQSNSFVNMETSPLLTFSDGSHHQIEQQTAYSIVEPWLPSNGDYSSYGLWLNDNQDHISASLSDVPERNPAFRISAALAYTTQLVNNLAHYLDVILPAKLELDTFSRGLLGEARFSYNVAKLNTNIIHLCVSQGVDVSLLHPHKTLKNLMLLLNMNVSDTGRKPIMDLDNDDVTVKIESKLATDLSLVQDSYFDFSKYTEDDDISDSEWEISDTINPSEMQLANERSIQQSSYISRLPLRLFASFWSTGS